MTRARKLKSRKPSKERLLADRMAIWPDSGLCPLCGRLMVRGPTIDQHHLIPRSRGGTKRYYVHRVCHTKLHKLFNETELALEFSSFEKLRAHPDVEKFVRWLRNRDPEFMSRHR
jgi:5-methylcytosine-specific restriction endonuclease McrA